MHEMALSTLRGASAPSDKSHLEQLSINAIRFLSLERRLRSREEEPFGDKLLAAMRNQFGGHAVKRVEAQE